MESYEKFTQTEDKKILLRRMDEGDKENLARLYDYPLSDEKAKMVYEMIQKDNGLYLAIVLKPENTFVGMIELTGEKAVLGYRVMKQYRHQHIARDAVYLLCRYMVNEGGLYEITAEADENNTASVRVLTHNGFEETDRKNGIIAYVYRPQKTECSAFVLPENRKAVVLAGGCFWGMERAFSALKGVQSTETGYANGHTENPTYADICRDDTGYKEAVRIVYDPSVLSLDILMEAYFICVDPTVKNRQGEDIGSQYQTGVYYMDEADREKLSDIFAEERRKHESFYTELEPLDVFYPAEEYHQKYLEKHPDGYCHIAFAEIAEIKGLNRKIH